MVAMPVHVKSYGVFDTPKIDPFTTTSNNYADVPVHWPDVVSEPRAYWPVDKLGGKSMWFKAQNKDLLVQILASLDGGASFPITAEPEFTIATATPVIKVIGEYYHALKIQVKPAVNDAHGTLTVQAAGSTLPSMADLSATALLDKTGLATENTLSTIDGKLAKGDQNKASSLSVTPATDITDGRYIGDIKFGEPLPAGTNIIGLVGIDQGTANANEVVLKSITAGPLPDTSGGALAALGGTVDGSEIQVDVVTLAAPATLPLPTGAATETTLDTIMDDIALMKADLAAILAILES